ncbi:MAG: hypothetical protein V1784_00600 [bacterium]
MQDTLLTIFTGVVAVVLLLQSFAFVGIYKSVRQLSTRMDSLSKDLLKKVDVLSTKVEDLLFTIKGMAEGLKSIQGKLADTTAIVHKRVVDLDTFLAETTSAARLEILRIQDVVDNVSRRIEETFDLLHNSILAPVNEVSAVIRGVKVGLDVLLRKRKSPSTSSHDEEMFI